MYHSEYWLNLKGLWIDWPIREIHRLEKWYYLVQYAFWIQQILVVNIEERRKDYHQMLAHHFITCALMFASYGYHMTRVGIAILCVMDVVDILLPLAKMLNYVHLKMACDIVFGVFLVTWFLARHVVYLLIMWSIYADLPVFIPPGCYSGPTGHIKGPFPAPDTFMHVVRPFMEPEGTVCFTKGIQWGFLTMLGALQIITCIWFVMIVKVAWKVIKGTGAEDTRSEDEDELDDQEEMEAEDADETGEFGDITVGKGLRPEVMFNGSARRKPARKGSNDPGGGGGVITDEDNTTSGIRLPGHSDRKELLRRIGCNNKI